MADSVGQLRSVCGVLLDLPRFLDGIIVQLLDELVDQATELLQNGYKLAAAVIAGTVLETSLRELCTRNGLPHGKLDKMNADLAKVPVYNANMAKRITALAGIRNSAAHGKPNDFTDADVKAMIDDIERFLSQHLP